MNTEEVNIIKRTWEVPSASLVDAGSAVLLRLFEKHPSNLEKFPFKDVPVHELKDNPRFRSHCGRVMRTFDESIKLLDQENYGPEIQKIWTDMTVGHLKRNISKSSYDELRQAIIEVLTEVCKLNEQEQQVWNKLLNIVYNIIYETLKENNVQ